MLKKIKNIGLSLFLLVHCSNGWATTSQEIFLQANQLVHNGDYAQALQMYDSVDHKSGMIWYNMGNCYFYQKEHIKAIWAWLKACKIGSKTVVANSRYNIAVAQNLLDIKAQAGYYPKVDFFLWQIIALFINYALFLFLIKMAKNRKKLLLLIFLMEIGILGTTFWYVKELKMEYAVVQNKADIRAGPAQNYHKLDHLQQGQIVKLLKACPMWIYVKDEQRQGWCSSDDLLII